MSSPSARLRRITAAGLVGLPALAPVAAGAAPAPPARQVAPQAADTSFGTVVGVAFDSLGGTALAGATVRVTGTERTGLTGADGSFRLERVPVGRRAVTLERRDLSAWLSDLAGRTAEVTTGGTARLVLAVPSAPSLLARHCPGAAAMVAGVAMDLLTLMPLPGTEVVLASSDGEAPDPGRVRAEQDGSYRFCLPGPAEVRLEAALGEARGRPVSLSVGAGDVVGRDLFLRATRPASIAGVVRDAGTGEPIPDVLIRLDGTRTRGVSGQDGRFALSGVPPGSLTLVAEHVAYGEARGDLEVDVEDTLDVEIELSPEAIPVTDLEVTVLARATSRRMAMGTRFDGIGRAEIEAMLPRTTSFYQMLGRANVPGLHVARVDYLDPVTKIQQPGVCVEVARRRSMFQDVCAGMVAVYFNDVQVADPETFLLDLDPGAIDRFQLLSPLEALGRYGGFQARNGVLVIYTRGN